jgi:hypothetical protein
MLADVDFMGLVKAGVLTDMIKGILQRTQTTVNE